MNLVSLYLSVFAFAEFKYAAVKTIFVDPTILANCMLIVADQYPDAKTRPDPKSYLKNYQSNKTCPETADKKSMVWMSYLQADPKRICEISNKQEIPLSKWVFDQNDNSIDPLTIFEKAMELNSGNIMGSLITIHSLLRNMARWSDQQYYTYESTPEQSDSFWNKFKDIRGDLKERGDGFRGDHAGSWYRFWGLSLWQVEKALSGSVVSFHKANCTNETIFVTRGLRNFQASSMAIMAELVKYMMPSSSTFDLTGKIKINNLGADLGAGFSAYLGNGMLNLTPDQRKKFFEKQCHEKKFFSTTSN